MKMPDQIKGLLDQVRELEASDENKRKKEKWQCLQKTSRDQWRGTPKLDGSCWNGMIPIEADANNTFWSKYYNFSLVDYFKKPEVFLEYYLKQTIERWKLFKDDVFVEKRIPIWMGSGFEASMFGMEVYFFDDADPNINYQRIIRNREDLKKVPEFDFYKLGQMPEALKIYEIVKEWVDDDFEVLFPKWLRGPFGLVTYIHGFEDTLVDMYTDPEFMHEIMRFVTDRRKMYYTEAEKYLGEKIVKADLFNDEVACPTLSPQNYNEFILPYEKELCEFHGGLYYWHSCGDVSELCEPISTMDIELMNRGPWTSVYEASKYMGHKSAIELCLNPQSDVMEGDYDSMYALMTSMLNDLYKNNAQGFTFRANNIIFYNSWDYSIGQAEKFVKASRKACDDFLSKI